ncbi:hypothetical protein [Parvibaculum sp.]|jgi:hypothetical protein|uniref:hypothetical protein n=1 Tax=Parvibaculum sp. TaxID=2024848 RepID=UPI002FDB043B
MKAHVACRRSGAALMLLLMGLAAGCAQPNEPSPAPATESQAKQVLDAQYAAKGNPKPMQASEADRIYENYLENIGEPLESESTTDE